MNRPNDACSYDEWQRWFGSKIERDFNMKIFLENEKEETRKDYDALMRVLAALFWMIKFKKLDKIKDSIVESWGRRCRSRRPR